MPKPLYVYGWRSTRREAKGHHSQTREVVAVRSRTEAVRAFRAFGHPLATDRDVREYGGPSGNAIEIAITMAEPGQVFWASLDGVRKAADYRRADPTP